VRQVGHLPKLYEDTRPEKYKTYLFSISRLLFRHLCKISKSDI